MKNTETNPKLVKMLEEGKIKEFLDILDQTHASKVYEIIRDNITPKHIRMIKEASDSTNCYYQTFQDIKLKAKQSWDHDHKMASMADVDRACTNLYTLVLRIIKALGDGTAREFDTVHLAINKIEEKLGLEITNWSEEPQDIQPTAETETDNDGGNNDVDDVQGVQEDI